MYIERFIDRSLRHLHNRRSPVYWATDSDIVLCTARLGLKAAALAWLKPAPALSNLRPAKAAAHGLAPAWLGPGRGF